MCFSQLEQNELPICLTMHLRSLHPDSRKQDKLLGGTQIGTATPGNNRDDTGRDNNLREFGRTTVILTTGAGNVGSEPRAMVKIPRARSSPRSETGNLPICQCIYIICIYIYIYIYVQNWPRCRKYTKNSRKENEQFSFRGLKTNGKSML